MFDVLGPVIPSDPLVRDHPLNHGRVGWWLPLPGLEGTPRWYDLCGRWSVTLNNGAAWKATTRPGGWAHVQFDGSDDYADVASFSLGSNSVTVAAWVYLTSWAGSAMIVEKEPVNGDWALLYSSSVLRMRGSGTAPEATTTAPSANAWHRVAGTITGTSAAVYVDGVLGGTSASQATTNTTDVLNFGRYSGSGAGFYLPGSLDDVSVWNRVLSAAEVQADYDLSRVGYPGVLWRRRPTLAIFPAPVVAAGGFPLVGGGFLTSPLVR